MKITKLLSTTAALCALSTFSAVSVQAETAKLTKANGNLVARSSGANTNSDYSRDKMMNPNRSDRSVMDQKRKTHMNKNKVVSQMKQTKVKEVQEALDSRGYAVGQIDGFWGHKTSSALKDFQSSQGIEATGRVNTETFNALGIQVDQKTRDTFYSERALRSTFSSVGPGVHTGEIIAKFFCESGPNSVKILSHHLMWPLIFRASSVGDDPSKVKDMVPYF